MPPRSVYIHIPFCSKKCYYCDFAAYQVDGQPIDAYLSALRNEMDLLVQMTPPETVHTIYIGGGTPSILNPRQMSRLLEAIEKAFPKRSKTFEFTVEANPESVSSDLLRILKDGGVNRISLGVQTFSPRLLKEIGRAHGIEEIIRSIEWIKKAEIPNLSLDLMFGLPRQTIVDIEDTLKYVLALEPQHLSCYSLKIEEGTRFYHLDRKNQLVLPTEDEEYLMYQLIRERLEQAGYRQYEISNFSIPGYESMHNTVYWLNDEYYGIGVGAHGYIEGVRYANVRGVQAYLQHLSEGRRPIDEAYQVSREESMENFMILGLRLLKGVNKTRFLNRYGESIEQVFGSVVQSLVKRSLIEEKREVIRLTEKGLLFGNEVFAAFLSEAH